MLSRLFNIGRVLIVSLSLLLSACQFSSPPNVSVVSLIRTPEQFAAQRISVEGVYKGGVIRLACLSQVGPPGDFFLGPMTTASYPVATPQYIFILYQPDQDETYVLGHVFRARMRVNGRWRFYDGPEHCSSGRTQRWYLEADTIEFLDTVPQRPTDLPYPLSRPTSTPFVPESTRVPTR